MKKRRIIIILGVILFISLCVIGIVYKNNDTLKLKESNFIFEFGDKVPFESSFYLKSTNQDIIKNSKIRFMYDYFVEVKDNEIKSLNSDYLKVGFYEMYIDYKDQKYKFNIEVKDTTKPEFVDFKEEIIIEQNALNVDLSNFYEATDLNSTTILIESDFDVSEVGEYKAIIKATDYYKNENQKESIIKVIPYEDIEKYDITKTVDDVEYKSQKRIDEENKKKEVALTKPSNANTNSNTSSSKNNNTTSNNNTNNSNSTKKETNNTVASATYRQDISDNLVKKINEYRKANGKSELPVTSETQAIANQRAKEIVTNPSHDGSVYGFGENIGGGGIGTDFFELWKNSFAHNNTLLRDQNTTIAVSIYQVDGMWYAVAAFKLDY